MVDDVHEDGFISTDTVRDEEEDGTETEGFQEEAVDGEDEEGIPGVPSNPPPFR